MRGRVGRPVTRARSSYNWRKVPQDYALPLAYIRWISEGGRKARCAYPALRPPGARYERASRNVADLGIQSTVTL